MFGKLCGENCGGGTPSRENAQYYEGDIPWATVKDLDSKIFKSDTIEHITEDAIKNSATNLINSGNVIIATRMGLGRGFINTVPMAINQDLKAIFPKENIDAKYLLFWYLNQSKTIESMGKGSTVKGIRLEDLKALQVLVPPFVEQRKIADILSTVDKQIEQTNALIEKTKELKKGLMQRLLTNGIRHTEFKDTEIGRIPKEWEVKELNEVAEIILGQSPDSSTYNEVGDGIPFFQGKTEFGYLYPVVKKWCSRPKKIAEIDDILISVRAPVGDVNINNVKACIGRGLAAIRKTEKLNERYLFYFLKKNSAVFEKLSQGSTFTAINGDDLKCLKIPVPTIQEQERIAMILTKVDDEIIKLDSIVIKMQELKKALMQKLLTGKVRVKL